MIEIAQSVWAQNAQRTYSRVFMPYLAEDAVVAVLVL